MKNLIINLKRNKRIKPNPIGSFDFEKGGYHQYEEHVYSNSFVTLKLCFAPGDPIPSILKIKLSVINGKESEKKEKEE